MIQRDHLTEKVIGCALEVHRALGPGLLESAYEKCLARELAIAQVSFRQQVSIPVEYKGVHLDCGFRIDLLVEDRLIIELKAVERVQEIHKAQILSYMKLSGINTGLILNFNVQLLKDGITRFKL